MKLGEKIKLLRTEQEMTQPTLAEKAGIEQSYLSKLEHDKGAPSFDIINRIAMALGTTGMHLIHSLSQSYVEDHLSHLPEVAVAYESQRIRSQNRARNLLLASAFAMVLGPALGYLGYSNVFFPERVWDYRSPGIIRPGEADNVFDGVFPQNSQFMPNPTQQSVISSRVQAEYLVSYRYLGKTFVREENDGRRIFQEYSTLGIERRENDLLLAAGILFFLAGMLGLTYNTSHGKQRNKQDDL